MSDKTILEIRRRLLDSMIDYMEIDEDASESDHDCGYTPADVDRCAGIVDAYLSTLAGNSNADQSEILRTVQYTVEQLNKLNDACNGCLIETDQREDLCALILAAAKDAGLKSEDDVTEEWREW